MVVVVSIDVGLPVLVVVENGPSSGLGMAGVGVVTLIARFGFGVGDVFAKTIADAIPDSTLPKNDLLPIADMIPSVHNKRLSRRPFFG